MMLGVCYNVDRYDELVNDGLVAGTVQTRIGAGTVPDSWTSNWKSMEEEHWASQDGRKRKALLRRNTCSDAVSEMVDWAIPAGWRIPWM